MFEQILILRDIFRYIEAKYFTVLYKQFHVSFISIFIQNDKIFARLNKTLF